MRLLLKILPPVFLLVVGWLVWPFFQSSEVQVARSHAELFELAGGRYWTEVGGLMSKDYDDAWGNNAEDAIEIASELLQGFLVLDLQWQTMTVVVDEDSKGKGLSATVTGKARIEGNGLGLSQMVMSRLNNLEEPWTFTWRKEDWKPGDWRLVSVTHPKLKDKIPSGF